MAGWNWFSEGASNEEDSNRNTQTARLERQGSNGKARTARLKAARVEATM